MAKHAYLQKYYVYDPCVNTGDEMGRLRVLEDDKGKHILASPLAIQYWLDQGLVGEKPLGELGDSMKSLLKQITRGRSEDVDKDPARLPKYDRAVQSGSPGFALRPASVLNKKRRARDKANAKKNGNNKPPTQKAPPPPPPKAA